MRTLDASRFHKAEEYAAYLRTLPGRLRSELAWESLSRHLPADTRKRRALDVGGGTGCLSIQLAKMGFEVVLLDSSEEMLEIARTYATSAGPELPIFLRADAGQLCDLFDAGSVDVAVCHNLLEYLEDPSRTVCDIALVLRKGGVLSALVRNRAGEVLRTAVKGDWPLATENLSAETVVDPLYGGPVRVFDPAEVRGMMSRAGLEVIAEYGVRVFSDYTGAEGLSGDSYARLFELELALGARPEFAAIARYTQVIARRASSREP